MIKVIAFCVAAACASQVQAQSLVGKWDCNAREGKGLAMRMLTHYRSTGHFNHLANVAVGDRRGRMDASISIRGAWTTSGNTLIEKINTGRVTALSIDKRDISKTPLGKQIGASLHQRIVKPNKLSRMQITFSGPDKMRLKDGKFTATCTKR